MAIWGLWHTCPGRRDRANSATIRPVRQLIIEGAVDV
jgi:hypothetical protein